MFFPVVVIFILYLPLAQRINAADLVFDPTLAFTRFSEDLLLKHAMITAYLPSTAYVDPFARARLGFATTDPLILFFYYTIHDDSVQVMIG